MGYSNQEVTHLWASGRKSNASSNHGNVYFQNGKLYSYGSHFLLGYAFHTARVAFLNSDGYSISTSKHKGYASQAVSHFETFRLPKLTELADFLDVIDSHRKHPRKGAELKALRERIERKFGDYIAAHPDAPRDGWQWIFAQAGIAAERMALVARKVDRVKTRKAAADEKEAVATWRANGRKYAEMSSSEFAGIILAIRHAENGYAGQSELENLANAIRLAHKQANADKHNRRKAVLWERLGKVRAALKALKESGVSSYNNQTRLSRTVRAIVQIRALERTLQAGTVPGPKAFDSVRGHVAALLADTHKAGIRPATREALTGYYNRLTAARDARSLVIEAERFEAERAEREAWVSGESSYTRARLSDDRGGALIRARGAELDGCNVTGGELETSHGARVPLRHAARVFAFVRAIRRGGVEWRADPARPVRVGHYQLDLVEASGDFVAGCHRINWSETERLARELGLWDCDTMALATGNDDSE